MRPAFGTGMMSLDFAIELWPVTVFALVVAIWGAIALVSARGLRTWQTLTVFSSLLFPAFVVPLYAVRIWANPRIHTPQTQEVPLAILFAGWGLFVFVLVASIAMARSFRWPLAGVASLIVWFGAGMYLVSVMAVSGIWL
jgi:hypothetical protein